MSLTLERRREVREAARALVATVGAANPPVPIERIAKGLGIAVRYAPLDEELSGMAFVKGGLKVVAVNALHHPNRQRFTIGHEMAHHVLHREILDAGVHVDKVIMRRDELSATGTNTREIEANVFASELLMPQALIASIVGTNFDLNDEARLIAIARRFRVSVAALQYRLASPD